METNLKYRILFFLISLLFFFNCSDKQETRELVSLSGKTMGTTFSIKIVPPSKSLLDLDTLEKEINDLLKEVNRQMSTYISDSEISQFNLMWDTSWFSISPDFAYVLQEAIKVSKGSNGAFDVTVGPLANLWGFGPELKEFNIPDKDTLLAAKAKVGYNLIEVRTNPPAVKKQIPGIYLDLNAIAPGFAVDKIGEYLESEDISDYMVELGGEVRTKGKKENGEAWKIGIETPDSFGDVHKIIAVSDFSISTSGDYHNYYELDSVRYSHTIDPRTGIPITHKLASVTVIHKLCILADAYATAIDVLGPEEGYSFALELDLPILIIARNKEGFIEKYTSDFEKFISEKKEINK